MSIVEEKSSETNFNFDQSEECFEFTPKSIDEDSISFTGTNDDNCIKPFLTHNNSRSSFRKSTPMKRNSNSLISNSPTNGFCSFNSHSSICFDPDDLVNNMEGRKFEFLNDQLLSINEQVKGLREEQIKNEEKYSAMKKENAALHNKVNFLEEHLRDIELQSEDKRKESEQRFRESMARLEREKAQELENYVNRVCALEKEKLEANEEIKRLQQSNERLQTAKDRLENELRHRNDEIITFKDEIKRLKEVIRTKNEQQQIIDPSIIEALNQLSVNGEMDEDGDVIDTGNDKEFENIHFELEKQIQYLKEENKNLKENNEELTAQLLNNHLIEGKSLLKEGEAISSLANEISDLNIEQLKTTLREQQDVNGKLRAYIDGILLNIVENYPQLLEVKSNGHL